MKKKVEIGERFVTYRMSDDEMRTLRRFLNDRNYRFHRTDRGGDKRYEIYRKIRVGEVISRYLSSELIVYNRMLERTIEALVEPNIDRRLKMDLEKEMIRTKNFIRRLGR